MIIGAVCKHKNQKEKRKLKKRISALLLSLLLVIISSVLVSCICSHVWKEATCTEPKTCVKCGATEGSANGHNWKNATCTEPKTCLTCGATEGSTTGHRWKAATCTVPKTCIDCGATEGSALSHDWQGPTCTSPVTCSRCKLTEGSALGHLWREATCKEPKTCIRCGTTTGSVADHRIVDYKCKVCGKTIITKSDIPNILDIVSLTYDLNTVGGIDQWIVIKNKSSSKTIKYVEYNVSYFNRVGDKIKDDISHKDYVILQYTGPLGPNETSNENQYWKACFYNSTFGGTMHFNSITVIYMDGTSLTFDDSIARYAVVNWRT